MSSGQATIWLNGETLPLEKARISPLDRGFVYGDGLFETIRAEKGKFLYLSMHLERLEASLAEFLIRLDPVPAWESILYRLLSENGLIARTAAIKIMVTRGISPSLGLPPPKEPTVCIVAQPYDPPSRRMYETGCKLHVYRDGYSPPLAMFKSLNFLYCLAARQAALNAGCDMAVILDRGGLVTETCTGSLIARTGGLWWTPQSRYQLPGTTVRSLSAILESAGSKVYLRPAPPEDLYSADTVWVLNSLIGIMPVAQIDEMPIANPAQAEAALLRNRLFNPA
ncbi:MAG TPA: aminotransferase class IV [Syntrophobacteraceae bacterium]|nr:aminotransferase class IV [Syntrophobacteraceae bacterium]